MNELLFCIKCGHELKTGAMYCPYCGTKVTYSEDLISTSARYENYNPINTNIEGRATMDGKCSPSREEPNSLIKCFTCSSLIPGDSKYCPICQTQLFVECPKCGHKYSAQYANCNECGTNREEYLKAQELAALAKQLVEKKRKEEEEQQRRRQEEARRLEEECRKANEPRILAFSASKYKRAEGDSVVFQWSTVNVDHCDLSWYNKRKKNCWHKCFPHNYGYGSLFVNLPPNCNKHTFGAGELLDMCSFIGLEQSVEICLEAFGKNGEIVSKYIRINLLAFAFSPLQVDSIEEI